MLPKLGHFLILAAISISASIGIAGPESGGGGGLVLISGKPTLVDFYTISGSAGLLARTFEGQASSRILNEETFILADKSSDPAFGLALQILKKWSDLPYDQIAFLIQTAPYHTVVWNITNDLIPRATYFRPTLLPKELEIVPGAYYLEKDHIYSVRISKTNWNQLSLQDQAGLVIHEILRHVQIGLSYHFEDESLQKATAMMMACRPRVKFDQYLYFLLNNRRDLAEARFEPFDQLTSECWK